LVKLKILSETYKLKGEVMLFGNEALPLIINY